MTTPTTPTTHHLVVDAATDRAAYPRAVAIALVLALLSWARLFLDAGDGGQTWSDVVAVAAFDAIALVIGFGAVVPKALRTAPTTAAWATVALAVLSVPVLVVFFFSGAALVLGYATWFLSRTSVVRAAGGRRPRACEIVALVVMLLSVVVNVALTVSGFNPGLPS